MIWAVFRTWQGWQIRYVNLVTLRFTFKTKVGQNALIAIVNTLKLMSLSFREIDFLKIVFIIPNDNGGGGYITRVYLQYLMSTSDFSLK